MKFKYFHTESITPDLHRLCDWPISVAYIQKCADGAYRSVEHSELPARSFLSNFLVGWGVLLRNLVFLVIVLAHGFRRLLPPYS